MPAIKIPQNSNITLYKNIHIAAGEQIAFNTLAVQEAYFAKNKAFTTKVSYVRKNGTIELQVPPSVVEGCNYLSFRNPDFENHIFYGAIAGWEYINNNCVQIAYTIDWFQTYMFDVSYEPCHIDREQLSKAGVQLYSTNTPYAAKNSYAMRSVEPLAVTRDLEKFYNHDDVISYPQYPEVIAGDDKTASYDMCMVLKFAMPAAMVKGSQDSYTLDADSDVGWDSLMQMCAVSDGFSAVNESTIDGIPSAVMFCYFNSVQREGTLFLTDYDNTPASQLRAAINRVTVQNMSSSILGMWACPRYFIEPICQYIGTGINKETRTITFAKRQYTPRPSLTPIPYPAGADYHPKLNMYPYSYLRAISPDGTVKEYQYEFFNYEAGALFDVLASFQGNFTQSIVPVTYRANLSEPPESGTGYASGYINWQERMDFNSFPQIPYTTDAYLTSLASLYSQRAASTDMVRDPVNFAQQMLPAAISAGAGMSGAGGQGAQGASSIGRSAESASSFLNGAINTTVDWSAQFEGAEIMSGQKDPMESRYRLSQTLYASDHYFPGSPDFLMLNYNPTLQFKLIPVELRADVKANYSDYLWTYGLNTQRYGTPLLVNYIKGSTVDESIPEFHSVRGSKAFTYVKTDDLTVLGKNMTACHFIENLFNSGCRFYEGSKL